MFHETRTLSVDACLGAKYKVCCKHHRQSSSRDDHRRDLHQPGTLALGPVSNPAEQRCPDRRLRQNRNQNHVAGRSSQENVFDASHDQFFVFRIKFRGEGRNRIQGNGYDGKGMQGKKYISASPSQHMKGVRGTQEEVSLLWLRKSTNPRSHPGMQQAR